MKNPDYEAPTARFRVTDMVTHEETIIERRLDDMAAIFGNAIIRGTAVISGLTIQQRMGVRI